MERRQNKPEETGTTLRHLLVLFAKQGGEKYRFTNTRLCKL